MDLFMTFLINILVLLFALLIVYQLYRVKEGLETSATTPTTSTSTYQPYDPNNPTILAQQNAGNIQVLKGQMDELVGIKKEVEDISGNLYTLTDQVNQYMLQQANSAQQQLPPSPPAISPTDLQYT
jgi:hypothetical protein